MINRSTTWYLCGHVLLFCQLKLLRHADMYCLILVKQLQASGYDYRDYISWKESCVFKMKNKNKNFRGSSGVVKDQDCIFSPLKTILANIIEQVFHTWKCTVKLVLEPLIRGKDFCRCAFLWRLGGEQHFPCLFPNSCQFISNIECYLIGRNNTPGTHFHVRFFSLYLLYFGI